MPPQAIVHSFQKGIGESLGSTAVIVAVGAVMGRLIEVSGGGEVIAQTMIQLLGDKRIPWAILVFAYLIGIPVFFDVGFITFVPLVCNISKVAKKSLLLYALPLFSGLMTSFARSDESGPGSSFTTSRRKSWRNGSLRTRNCSSHGSRRRDFYAGWIAKRIFVEAPENLMPKGETTEINMTHRPTFRTVLYRLVSRRADRIWSFDLSPVPECFEPCPLGEFPCLSSHRPSYSDDISFGSAGTANWDTPGGANATHHDFLEFGGFAHPDHRC